MIINLDQHASQTVHLIPQLCITKIKIKDSIRIFLDFLQTLYI